MKFTSGLILGSGFGLYGYFPAMVKLGMKVHTLERYADIIEKRDDLKAIKEKIIYVKTEDLNSAHYDVVVIARKPQEQINYILANLNYKGHFFLEKPIAPSLESTKNILDQIKKNQINFSVAYTFSLTNWYKLLEQRLNEDSSIEVSITWGVNEPVAHWKKNNFEGGGFVNYYFIHFIPLLIKLNKYYKINITTAHGHNEFFCKVRIKNRILKIRIFFTDIPLFEINYFNSVIKNFKYDSPFEKPILSKFTDPRIEFLVRYMCTIANSNENRSRIDLEYSILEFRSKFM